MTFSLLFTSVMCFRFTRKATWFFGLPPLGRPLSAYDLTRNYLGSCVSAVLLLRLAYGNEEWWLIHQAAGRCCTRNAEMFPDTGRSGSGIAPILVTNSITPVYRVATIRELVS